MLFGTVKMVSAAKGFGFIEPDGAAPDIAAMKLGGVIKQRRWCCAG